MQAMSEMHAPVIRPVIYQLFVRLFGNTNMTRTKNGTLAENGCGRFADINGTALTSLKDMGFTHIWLTGVIEHASGTGYPCRPADDRDILKGEAGSPYAIRDYFDVCPDYALDPEKRIDEFRDLLDRCHRYGLKVIIDFVPNHVSRCYASDIRPEHTFGQGDDRDVFFHRDNHYYYLRPGDPGDGPPLKLPGSGDGFFGPEAEYGKVTGNNVISWTPSVNDWYETVKINYGHDFTTGRDTSHLPGPDAPPEDVPKTWRTMDEILRYWQEMGVDGFRADMAHMVPMEFWRWAVKRARARQPGVFFSAEAYNNDPAKLTDGHVLDALLDAGFDGVYDKQTYDIAEGIYDSGKWANDFDGGEFATERFHRSLRFVENHDEVRVACPDVWGGHGMRAGRPASAVLLGMGRGPIMIYSGQEIGEAGGDESGFSTDHKRTTIFDYWCMKEFVKWVNGGRYDGGGLSPEQKDLRAWYCKLLNVLARPAFTRGEFFGLNWFNRENPAFGRQPGEKVSGHWIYAFLRHDRESGESLLVVANFHPDQDMTDLCILIPEGAWEFMGREQDREWAFHDRLEGSWRGVTDRDSLDTDGIRIGTLEAMNAAVLEISKW
jgi:glycosidase